jgi:hypothetical protein
MGASKTVGVTVLGLGGLLLLVALSSGCDLDFGDSCGSAVLYTGAEFNPALGANAFQGLSETSQAVAQTFTVPSFADEPIVQVLLALTRGPSADTGLIRVDLRYVDAMGVPRTDPSAVFTSAVVDTSRLPPPATDAFTVIDLPAVKLAPGAVYAIVVEFLARNEATDDQDIAIVVGVDGDLYSQGDGFTGAPDIAFVPSGEDYLFSTTHVFCLDYYYW